MAHARARLSVFARRLIVARVRGQGWGQAQVAEQLGVSRQTVAKWLARFAAEGAAGLVDRSSRPRRSPHRTAPDVEARVVAARQQQRRGAAALAPLLGLPASTIGRVLRRHGCPPLADLDRVTGAPVRSSRRKVRRYERSRPGELLHVDVKKLGRIPPGGGWRLHGRGPKPTDRRGGGFDFVHVAVDDYTRLAYIEVLPDERGLTCAAFLHRAVGWFRSQGVVVERVLTDNAFAYRRDRCWAAVCTAWQISRRWIKPGCPWTNGKAERLNRTLLTEWAYGQAWTSNAHRTAALDDWVTDYNTARGHSALAGRPPSSRLPA